MHGKGMYFSHVLVRRKPENDLSVRQKISNVSFGVLIPDLLTMSHQCRAARIMYWKRGGAVVMLSNF